VAETPFSLLERLTRSPTGRDWEAFVALYDPILRGWLRRALARPTDADDLVQEVFQVIVERLPDFRHSGNPGAFRAWLRAILTNRLRHFWRAQARRPTVPITGAVEEDLERDDGPAADLAREWDQEHDRLVMGRLMELIRPEFTESTWAAFRRYALEGVSAADTARELGLSVNAVCMAKSRVLRRLREEARGLIGE
jgi:RNA polymerase sigma factor (sigma-70 family)